MFKEMKIIKNVLNIIIICCIAAMCAYAQQNHMGNHGPSDDSFIQSHQLMRAGTNYNGTVYEPFSNTLPSEQSEVGSSTHKTGPRKSKENPTDPGITDDENSPIGDAALPLMIFAVLFAGIVYVRRTKKHETN